MFNNSVHFLDFLAEVIQQTILATQHNESIDVFQVITKVADGDFNSHHGVRGSQLSNSNGGNLAGVIEKYDYVILNTAFRPIFSDWTCLMERVGFNIGFKFLGFAQFQHDRQRSPWQRSYGNFT